MASTSQGAKPILKRAKIQAASKARDEVSRRVESNKLGDLADPVGWLRAIEKEVDEAYFGHPDIDVPRKQKAVASALIGGSPDAKKLRRGLTAHRMVLPYADNDRGDDIAFRLGWLFRFALCASALQVDRQNMVMFSAPEMAERIDGLAKAADDFRDAVERCRDSIPIPPLWYFLTDAESLDLLRVLDWSRNGRDTGQVDSWARDVAAHRDGLDRFAVAAGEYHPLEDWEERRKYRYASGVVWRTRAYPIRWTAPKGESFLAADTAEMMRAFAAYARRLKGDIDSSVRRRPDGGLDAVERLLAKHVMMGLQCTFDVDPNSMPWAAVACCVK